MNHRSLLLLCAVSSGCLIFSVFAVTQLSHASQTAAKPASEPPANVVRTDYPDWPIAMARKGTGAKRLDEPTLTAADWAEAAPHLIAEGGLGALTVGALAVRLGVTKGSLYWHFQGRAQLLAAALGRLERRGTTEALP